MPTSAPAKPILALSVCFAGKREVPEAARPALESALAMIFGQLGGSLGACHEAVAAGDALALRFTDEQPARLTLVTGLADGADQIAADRFLAGDHDGMGRVERMLGAVLPSSRDVFVANSRVEDAETFERQADACAFVLELDGTLPAEGDAPRRARIGQQRGNAFSAQSEVLLRNGDLLVAVEDRGHSNQLGGTGQSIRSAIEFGLPVILVRLGEPGLAILRSRADLEHPVQLGDEAAAAAVAALVEELIGVASLDPEEGYVDSLVAEFYATGPRRRRLLGLEPLLPGVWSWFERRIGKERPGASGKPPPEPQGAYRRRASQLSGYYAGLYRGSFLVGYGLAVLAVALAAVSLLTLLAIVLHELPQQPGLILLFSLGLLKLLAVISMAALAKHAHDQHLSHRAADYRYLAERLRTMIFLPYAGSLRPPPHMSQPYTTRVASQGVIDRLFYSIVRQAEPEPDPSAANAVLLDPVNAMDVVRDDWLTVQRRYHQANARGLARMAEWLERWSRRVNFAIVAIVVVDLAIVGLDVLHLLPHEWAGVLQAGAEPVLLAIAAILPAAVAGMNGVRFQSEVSRLADRSEQMSYELLHLEQRATALWARSGRLTDVLHVAEDAARLTLDEVAEWTAIYGKEFVEM